MNVDLQTDFDHELSIHQFPFSKLIKSNDLFLRSLRSEFAELAPKSKLHWYFIEFISEQEWAQKSADPGMEQRGRKVITAFEEGVRNGTFGERYFGRFILETATVKNLTLLQKKLDVFKKYVFKDSNRDNYKEYARAAAKSMILICNKIGIPGLSRSLLQAIADMDVERDITIEIFLIHIDQTRQEEIRSNYDVLKTIADELINEEIGRQSPQTGHAHFLPFQQPAQAEITLTDRTLREINIIYHIFKSQYSKYDASQWNAYPTVLGKDGRSGVDGNYIHHMDIFSDGELFNVQAFKKQITERFEQSTNHSLLENQLFEIEKAAQDALDFYNQKLTKCNPIVDDFLTDHSRPLAERFHERDKYAALVIVYNYQIGNIYLGDDGHSIDRQAMHITSMQYNYPADNFLLATVCQHINDFIQKLGLFKQRKNVSDKQPENPTSIFRDPTATERYLDFLKNVKPAVIDQQGNFSLTDRKKAAVVAWFNALDAAHKIDNLISPDKRTELVQQMIPGLKISTRAFRNKHGVYNHYFPLFQKMAAAL